MWSSVELQHGRMVCRCCHMEGPEFLYPHFEKRSEIDKDIEARWNKALQPKRRIPEIVTFKSKLEVKTEED